jgi:hypothetical protein
MSENPDHKISQKNLNSNFLGKLTTLKYKLLKGKITPEEFRSILLEADQSTGDRASSQYTYYFLKEPAIEKYFARSDFKTNYFLFLSFSTFHFAQYLTIGKKNQTMALELFRESLSQLQQIPESELDADSILYHKATIAYFLQDVGEMERLKSHMNPKGNLSVNISVVGRLIDGIKTHKDIDYTRDYFGIESSNK